MRGKRQLLRNRGFGVRITPADAGKTPRHSANKNLIRDHPRGCGENLRSNRLRALRSGSPPRMRGKPADREIGHELTRITPADAGKTPDGLYTNAFLQDHPRGCGENKSNQRT